jgi:hypothetical protein
MMPRTSTSGSKGVQETGGCRSHDEVAAREQGAKKHPARKLAVVRIQKAIRDECERQRAALAIKETADAQITLLASILGELLSQAEFVAVLKAAGFMAIPRIVQQRLQPQCRETCPITMSGNMNQGSIAFHQDRLTGAPEEAAAILAGQTLPVRSVQALDRMSPVRRAVVASLMNAVNNVTGDFAHALLAGTPEGMRTTVVRSQRIDNSRVKRFARIEKRLLNLHTKNQMLSARHNGNLRYLAVCVSYIRGWIHNRQVLAWLRQHYPVPAASLEQITKDADCAREPGRAMKLPYARDRTAGPVSAKDARRLARARRP